MIIIKFMNYGEVM